jgi:hypothetical protein
MIMKAKHIIFYGLIAAMLTLAFTACSPEPEPEPEPEPHVHEWEWEVTIPATTEAEGLETETCKICGETSGETRPIAKQQAGFTITFTQIAEGAPEITGPTIHRDGDNGDTTATLTVNDPAQYSSIEWYIDGSLRRTGETLNLNAANYSIGGHFISLEVVKGGVPYNRTITFTVAE